MKIEIEKIEVTEDLYLGGFVKSDIPNLAEYLNDTSIFDNTLYVPYPYTELDAQQWVNSQKHTFKEFGRQVNWSIKSKNHGLIGGIGLLMTNGLSASKEEIGYWLGKPFRGRGIMTQVIHSFFNFCVEKRGYSSLEAQVFHFNNPSMITLLKAGFSIKAYLEKGMEKQGRKIDTVLFRKRK